MNIPDQLNREIKEINQVFQSFGIKARCTPKRTKIGGKRIILYGIEIAHGQAISDVGKRTRELNAAVSLLRGKITLVRINELPLRLEVDHPEKENLVFDYKFLKGNKNQILLGKMYNAKSSGLWLDIDSMPHCLVPPGS